MSDKIIATRGRLHRLSALAKLCRIPSRFITRLFRSRPILTADHLDDWIRRDVGAEADPRPDHRGEHYRKLLKRGQPLP